MEKYYNEIVQTLVDSYKDDEQLLGDMLYYLYETTDCLSLKNTITDVMYDLNRCISCGGSLVVYEYEESHTELDDGGSEVFLAKLCSNCDRAEIKELHAKEKS